MDVFCGLETVNWEDPFPAEYDVEKAAEYIKGFNPQMKELKKARRDFFGSNVIELCKKADFVFLGLHGANGEDGKLQAAFYLFLFINNHRHTGFYVLIQLPCRFFRQDNTALCTAPVRHI